MEAFVGACPTSVGGSTRNDCVQKSACKGIPRQLFFFFEPEGYLALEQHVLPMALTYVQLNSPLASSKCFHDEQVSVAHSCPPKLQSWRGCQEWTASTATSMAQCLASHSTSEALKSEYQFNQSHRLTIPSKTARYMSPHDRGV